MYVLFNVGNRTYIKGMNCKNNEIIPTILTETKNIILHRIVRSICLQQNEYIEFFQKCLFHFFMGYFYKGIRTTVHLLDFQIIVNPKKVVLSTYLNPQPKRSREK